MPHFHLCCQLEDGPTPENTIPFVDEFICAEMPRYDPNNPAASNIKLHANENASILTPLYITKYQDAVSGNMAHVCSANVNGCKKTANERCRREYDRIAAIPYTTIDPQTLRVKYRRRTAADFRIVPHNRQLLMDWDGHINTEWCNSISGVLYTYNYLYKGAKKQSVVLQAVQNEAELLDSRNEVKLFIKGRTLCRYFEYNLIKLFYFSLILIYFYHVLCIIF